MISLNISGNWTKSLDELVAKLHPPISTLSRRRGLGSFLLRVGQVSSDGVIFDLDSLVCELRKQQKLNESYLQKIAMLKNVDIGLLCYLDPEVGEVHSSRAISLSSENLAWLATLGAYLDCIECQPHR